MQGFVSMILIISILILFVKLVQLVQSSAIQMETLYLGKYTVSSSSLVHTLLRLRLLNLYTIFFSSPGYFGTSQTPCSGCMAGSASPGGLVTSYNNACTTCPAGFFAPSNLAIACAACPGKSGSGYATCSPTTGNDATW